ncbi:MAG: sodium:calcium antiporter [Candidatus Diapherotrites archaeon]|nr:sodium:calcium antiporter [Candidatus Diapherotrites archaeon]MDZ4256943.1 sodium:calcium antiporter [archaeon]
MEDLYVQGAVFLLSSIVLVKTASMAVKEVTNLARVFYISEFITAFVLGGFISMLPEFFVGVNSALEGVPIVGVGTLIGNNIVDLTLVFGIIAILGKDIPVSRSERSGALPFLIMVGLPLGLMLDGNLNRLDGLLLVIAALIYFIRIFSQHAMQDKKRPVRRHLLMKPLLFFGAAMLVMFGSAHFVVESAVNVADGLNIPALFAGLFLISIGAALPELTLSVKAVLSRHKAIAVGDIMGNVMIDSTFALGVLALISPVAVDVGAVGIATLFMVFAALLVTTLMDSGGKLTQREGYALIGLYVVFVAVQLALSSGNGFGVS